MSDLKTIEKEGLLNIIKFSRKEIQRIKILRENKKKETMEQLFFYMKTYQPEHFRNSKIFNNAITAIVVDYLELEEDIQELKKIIEWCKKRIKKIERGY